MLTWPFYSYMFARVHSYDTSVQLRYMHTSQHNVFAASQRTRYSNLEQRRSRVAQIRTCRTWTEGTPEVVQVGIQLEKVGGGSSKEVGLSLADSMHTSTDNMTTDGLCGNAYVG